MLFRHLLKAAIIPIYLNSCATAIDEPEMSPDEGSSYSVGDTGAGGGKIFKVEQIDSGFRYYECVYYTALNWGPQDVLVGTSQADGAGQANTESIITAFESGVGDDYAAHSINALPVESNSTNWWLASLGECHYIHSSLPTFIIGTMNNPQITTSSEYNIEKVYSVSPSISTPTILDVFQEYKIDSGGLGCRCIAIRYFDEYRSVLDNDDSFEPDTCNYGNDLCLVRNFTESYSTNYNVDVTVNNDEITLNPFKELQDEMSFSMRIKSLSSSSFSSFSDTGGKIYTWSQFSLSFGSVYLTFIEKHSIFGFAVGDTEERTCYINCMIYNNASDYIDETVELTQNEWVFISVKKKRTKVDGVNKWLVQVKINETVFEGYTNYNTSLLNVKVRSFIRFYKTQIGHFVGTLDMNGENDFYIDSIQAMYGDSDYLAPELNNAEEWWL